VVDGEVILNKGSRKVKAGKNAKLAFSLMDVEKVDGVLWILDVIWWDGVYVYTLPITERLLCYKDLSVKHLMVKVQEFFEFPKPGWLEGFIVAMPDGILKKWKKEPTVDLLRVNIGGRPTFMTCDRVEVKGLRVQDLSNTERGVIYECAFSDDRLVVLKARPDKQSANTYNTYTVTKSVVGWNPFVQEFDPPEVEFESWMEQEFVDHGCVSVAGIKEEFGDDFEYDETKYDMFYGLLYKKTEQKKEMPAALILSDLMLYGESESPEGEVIHNVYFNQMKQMYFFVDYMKARKVILSLQKKHTERTLTRVFMSMFQVGEVCSYQIYERLKRYFKLDQPVCYTGGLFFDSSKVKDDVFSLYLTEPRLFSEVVHNFKGKYSVNEIKFILSYDRFFLKNGRWQVGPKKKLIVNDLINEALMSELERVVQFEKSFDMGLFRPVSSRVDEVAKRFKKRIMYIGERAFVYEDFVPDIEDMELMSRLYADFREGVDLVQDDEHVSRLIRSRMGRSPTFSPGIVETEASKIPY